MDGQDPVGFLLTCMFWGGMTNYKARSNIWVLFSFYQGLLLFLHMATAFMNVPYAEDFWNDAMESLQLGISAIHLLTKHFAFSYNRDAYTALFKELEDVWAECWEDEDNREVMKKEKKRADMWTMGLLSCFAGGIVTQNSFTALSNWIHGKEKLPFQTYTPEVLGSYVFRVFIQEWIVLGAVVGDGLSCAYYKTYAILICSLLGVLRRQIIDDKSDRRNVYALHGKISKLILHLNEVHSGQIAFEVFMTSVIICIRGYACVKALAKNDPMVIGYIYILFLCLISTYLICVNGTMIADESGKLHFAIYESEWYDKSAKINKDLHFLSVLTTKPMTLNYRKLLTFDMVRFGIVLQGTYSYLTILRFFDSS